MSLCLLVAALLGQAQVSLKRIADLPDEMFETSGLVFYDQTYLLTHNDGGNDPEIFVLDLQGNPVKRISISGAKNKDWEDLTVDDEGHVYIGDFGNNYNKRESCRIYKLPKDLVSKDQVEAKKIDFTFEDQKQFPPDKSELNFDCEAFFWKDDSLYLFTKCRTEPFTGITNIYVLPDEPGEYTARKIASLQLCSSDWRFCSVTAADYSAEYNFIVLLTYSRLYVVTDFDGNDFSRVRLKSYQLSFVRQREAICFKSKNSWYMTDEYRFGLGGGNLYEVTLN